MPVIEKIGYIAILYWGCKLSRKILRKLYQTLFSPNVSVDLYSMGKWAVVTGCSNGIGKSYAEALAKIGLNIVLISHDLEKIKVIAQEMETMYNVKTKLLVIDFSNDLETYRTIEKEILDLEVGILINNMGLSYPHPEYFLDLPHREKIYMNIIQRNVIVVTNMCRILLPQMVVRGRGVVVNVSSFHAILPSPLLTVFAASKAYVLKFTKDLSIEYGKRGIIIQCLLPGPFVSDKPDSPSEGWIIPTAEKYVESAIGSIGKEHITTGFFPHAIFIGVIKLVYRISSSLVFLWMTHIMETGRNRALRRYIG